MIGDTIYAIASPPGAAARGVLRLSGPDAFTAAQRTLREPPPSVRATTEGAVSVLGYDVSCVVLTMPAPNSYTGEDVVELHLPGSPVLLDEVCSGFAPVARLATPGEFTRRAFENGRLDLAEAEAVLQLIHAADEDESRFALDVLRGGLSTSIDRIRHEILDGLALLEAGLDFEEGETGAVSRELWSRHLVAARQGCEGLLAGLPRVGAHGEILLLGAANAGKSSLANALVAAAGGRPSALVADLAGTTRDVLALDLAPGLRLLDGPGDLGGEDLENGIDTPDVLALRLRDRLAEGVAGVLEVVDLTSPQEPTRREGVPVLARVLTKVDLCPADASSAAPFSAASSGAVSSGNGGVPEFVVSSHTGAGLTELLAFLRDRGGGGARGLSTRLHAEVTGARLALRRALAGAEDDMPEELVALDLTEALDCLARVHGEPSPEDVLDRIFGGFCLGK